jgi:hypothetical protein
VFIEGAYQYLVVERARTVTYAAGITCRVTNP